MGTRGTGILDNDLAMNVKAVFEAEVEEGKSATEAAEAVRAELDEAMEDIDSILALAWILSKCGALPPELRRAAAHLIRSGQSLRRWEGAPEYRERQQVENHFLAVLEGKEHLKPEKRVRYNRPKVGDIFALPLSDGRRAFCQFVSSASKYGDLLQFYRLKTSSEPLPDEILASGPMFPPVISFLRVAMKVCGWKLVGHSPVTGFVFPTFRGGNRGAWWLYDGGEARYVGELSPECDALESLLIWPPVELVRRVETGVNPFAGM